MLAAEVALAKGAVTDDALSRLAASGGGATDSLRRHDVGSLVVESKRFDESRGCLYSQKTVSM